MATISVVVGTFGDPKWMELAERALASVERQTKRPASVHQVHADTLHEARNLGAEQACGEYLAFLDADDELDEHYIEEMSAVADTVNGYALIQPATVAVVNGNADKAPNLIPQRNLFEANFMVIGTLVPRKLFRDIGGFGDFEFYEDWELWLRCTIAGAEHVQAPGAVYRIWVNTNGRNGAPREEQVRVYNEIRALHELSWRTR